MIQFANDATKLQVWDMWKAVFGDMDAYMQIYFRTKYRNENTLVYIESGRAVASLQMLPYMFSFNNTEIPILYLSGVSTLPEARNKGYMTSLMRKGIEEAHRRGVALMVLVPQEKWLLQFYDKYGFAQTFDEGEESLPSLKKLMEWHHGEKMSAYKEFDSWFRQKDMTIQKTYDDFLSIVEEAALFDFPDKKNLIGMSRVINVPLLLNAFAANYPYFQFQFVLEDDLLPSNKGLYTIKEGKVDKSEPKQTTGIKIMDVRYLVQLLLGYQTSRFDEHIREIFPEKRPQMNFMLE